MIEWLVQSSFFRYLAGNRDLLFNVLSTAQGHLRTNKKTVVSRNTFKTRLRSKAVSKLDLADKILAGVCIMVYFLTTVILTTTVIVSV